jgi:RHS repeat-associated protein
MPAPLPPVSGYTYAVELTAEEALAAGAKEVRFSQPVIQYVENFLDFPVGVIVPVGYYDREKGVWIASNNGRVIKILSIVGVLANLDTDGDDLADNGPALGVTDAERQQLASLYPAGQSLWRVPIPHFSPFDCNWPYAPAPDATPPGQPSPGSPGNSGNDNSTDDPCTSSGSIIECQNQVLGETAPITGTPFSLNYRSDRVPGRRAAYTLDIPLSGASVPASLRRIELTFSVAGQQYSESFGPASNQTFSFTWDGKDAYGRTLYGSQPITGRIDYVYRAVYLNPVEKEQAFGRFGEVPLSENAARQEITISQFWQTVIGGFDTRGIGLGGWTIGGHHAYDPITSVVYLGDGKRRRLGPREVGAIKTIAGNGSYISSGDGGPATSAGMNPVSVALDGQGNLFIADMNKFIRIMRPDGVITTVAGNGDSCWPATALCGDGGPATSAQLIGPYSVAVDAQGNLFIADYYRVRMVGPDGIITTVAGTGEICASTTDPCGDGGPATSAQLHGSVWDVAVDGQGNLFIADLYRVRMVGPDGIITTVAGTGWEGIEGDGGPATSALLGAVNGLVVDGQGNLFVSDGSNRRIRMVGPDGIITRVAGGGIPCWWPTEPCGDGGPATDAYIIPLGLALNAQGNLFITDQGHSRIRMVGPDGIITTVAGTGMEGFSGDGGPATAANLRSPYDVVVDPQGNLLIADSGNSRVRMIELFMLFSTSNISIASEDGSQLYRFNSTGKHLQTLSTLTGAILYNFSYDSAGRLAQITDGDGNVTTIERNASGDPTGILGPYGQRTTLGLDANGYLANITNPASETVRLAYTSDGLLTSFTDPKGDTSTITYDAQGRLIRDEDPEGGFSALGRTENRKDYEVTQTTALGRVTRYKVERLSTGDTRRVSTSPTGAQTELIIGPDGSRQLTDPEGTITTMVEGPDPRFGMQSPLPTAITSVSPGGISDTFSMNREVTLSDPTDLLSLTAQNDTITLNGQIYTSVFNAGSRQITNRTPLGRETIMTFNSLGRVLSFLPDSALIPITFTYDGRGRVIETTQGSQTTRYNYDTLGRLNEKRDSLGNTIGIDYDNVNRPIQWRLPSGRTYGFAYDANGNLNQVAMPSGAVHGLDYTKINLDKNYTAPDSSSYSWSYDLDRTWVRTMLSSGRTVDAGYDNGGRPTGYEFPEASVIITYGVGDNTLRVNRIVRTPAGGGTPQAIGFTYDGSLVTGTAFSGTANGQFSYTYDNGFLLKGMNLISGTDRFNRVFVRDNDNLIINDGPFTITRGGPEGRASSIQDGMMNIAIAYDNMARMMSRAHTVNGQIIYRIQFSYDGVGRLLRKVETIFGTSHTFDYSYDADSQLTAVNRDGTLFETYAYDLNGNRINAKVGGNPTEMATYNALDQLTLRGGVSYQYDADGFLIQRGTETFQYSARGELLQATVGGQIVTYAYDGFGRRIARTDSLGTFQYLYGNPQNSLQVSALRDPGGILSVYYYDDYGNLYALRRGSEMFYIATDQVGTPLAVSDVNGNMVKTVEHESYGDLLSDSNPNFGLPIGFAGGLSDPVTGLVRFGLRDYDPSAGRWAARDGAFYKGQQANLYAYVNNNPLNLTDPSGLLTAEASLYGGIGFGIKFGISKEGVSLCGEVGFGGGGGFALDPFEGLDRSGNTFLGEFSGKWGAVGLGGKIELDDCGRIQGEAKGCVGGVICEKWKYDFDEGKLDFGGEGNKDLPDSLKQQQKSWGGKNGVEFEAKIAARSCTQIKW